MTTETNRVMPIDARTIRFTKDFGNSKGDVFALGMGKFRGKAFEHVANRPTLRAALLEIGVAVNSGEEGLPIPGAAIDTYETTNAGELRFNYQEIGLWYEVENLDVYDWLSRETGKLKIIDDDVMEVKNV